MTAAQLQVSTTKPSTVKKSKKAEMKRSMSAAAGGNRKSKKVAAKNSLIQNLDPISIDGPNVNMREESGAIEAANAAPLEIKKLPLPLQD